MTADVRALRRAALVAVLAGELAAYVSGVLPAALLGVAVLVTGAGGAIAAQASCARSVHLRRGSTVAVGLLAVAALPQLSGGGEDGLRGVLGPLLVGVVSIQTWTWHTLRDLRTGVLAATGLLVLGASYAPDVLVGLPLLVGWGAVLVALVLLPRIAVAHGADVVLATTSPRPLPLVGPALAAVLGLVAFLLVPVPEDATLQSRLARSALADVAGSGRAAPGAYTGDRVDLRTRGELSDEPLLVVAADSPVLWRSGVYADWDGTTWSRPEVLDHLAGPPFVVAETAGSTRIDEVRVRRRAAGTVWAPGPVLSVELLGTAAVVDAFGAVRGQTWPGYTVRSAVVAPTADSLRAAAGADELDPRWTALPAGLPERVTALGRELAGSAPTRIDAVLAVERWLGENATYRLDSPVPGPGEDAVDRFLFVDRVGFCEQFAAAEVLLLRAAGIPARFVTGLAYGVDGRDGRRTFRQKDLHAWAEVFHPGVGWVSSDPTPPSTQLAGAPLRVRVAAELSALLRRADGVPGGRPAIAAVLLALSAAVAGWLGLRRRGAAAADRVLAPLVTGGGPALQAFRRFDGRLGERRRRPSESLGELQTRLDLPSELRDALAVVDQECYGASPPPGVADTVAVLDRAGQAVSAGRTSGGD